MSAKIEALLGAVNITISSYTMEKTTTYEVLEGSVLGTTMEKRMNNGSLCKMPCGKSLGSLLMDLQSVSVHDANRVRRLFDCGCPKAIIVHLCQMLGEVERNQYITEEEKKLYLDPLQPLDS